MVSLASREVLSRKHNVFCVSDLYKDEKETYTSSFFKSKKMEVKAQPISPQKNTLNFMKVLPLSLPVLLISSKAHAETEIQFPMLDKAPGLEILPKEVVEILIQLVIGCGIIGVVFAILCLMIAGGYRMIGQTDKARVWSVDIIKGLGQILLAPVIILLLVTIVGLMFGNIPGLDLFF